MLDSFSNFSRLKNARLLFFIIIPIFLVSCDSLGNKKELDTFQNLTLSKKIDAMDEIWGKIGNSPEKLSKLDTQKQILITDEYKSLDFSEQRKIINLIMAECVYDRRSPTQLHALLASITTDVIVQQDIQKQIDWALLNLYATGRFDKMLLDAIAKNVNFAIETNDPNITWDMFSKYALALKEKDSL